MHHSCENNHARDKETEKHKGIRICPVRFTNCIRVADIPTGANRPGCNAKSVTTCRNITPTSVENSQQQAISREAEINGRQYCRHRRHFFFLSVSSP